MAARRAHNSSATIPASGPYVWPNDVLNEKNAPSPIVATNQSVVHTAAPNAIHDSAGWRRRGEWRKTIVVAAVTSTIARGQRAKPQNRLSAWLSIELPIDVPSARSVNAP